MIRYFVVTGTASRPSGALYHDHRPAKGGSTSGVLGSAILFGPVEVPHWLKHASLSQIMTAWSTNGNLEKPKRKVKA